MATNERKYLCIHCVKPAKALFKKSDGDFIKLYECLTCGKTVDRYVECEKSIIFMDMLLQEITVYRHILFNADNFTSQFYIKLAVSLILSEGYVRWSSISHHLSPDNGITNNEIYLYIMCLLTTIEIGVFAIVITGYSWIKFPSGPRPPIYVGLLLGQCGRLANIAAIVWYSGSSLTFQALMLVFTFISSIQSNRAALHAGKLESFFLVTSASSASLASFYLLQPLLLQKYLQ
ncbi:hypothetical protein Pcinc_010519 [Petrolisthes cinctipes]|uniref:Protein ARV n=1 Tax=Petrolisthes cinctipes TaxID=88211 RepID=A0AAE1G4N6_PETCI|nr:hypothetical protein Pcinc_010519 [Petrolisthes cinctipes]